MPYKGPIPQSEAKGHSPCHILGTSCKICSFEIQSNIIGKKSPFILCFDYLSMHSRFYLNILIVMDATQINLMSLSYYNLGDKRSTPYQYFPSRHSLMALFTIVHSLYENEEPATCNLFCSTDEELL